ncbi:hypothetical protein ACH5RR_008298 [Cinchona calisaya]|uniref:Uncharacterized protein n=1 Tax=Cinchona calisaya TaxID=153742 RepID=A0ABD3AAZ5_9GENT
MEIGAAGVIGRGEKVARVRRKGNSERLVVEEERYVYKSDGRIRGRYEGKGKGRLGDYMEEKKKRWVACMGMGMGNGKEGEE